MTSNNNRRELIESIAIVLLAAIACSACVSGRVATPNQNQTSSQIGDDVVACAAVEKAYYDDGRTGAMIGGGWLGLLTHKANSRLITSIG